MKVLFLTHGFPPAQHSGVFRSAAVARYLPEFGITPIVLCGEPGSFSRVPEYGAASDAVGNIGHLPQRVDWRLQRGPQEVSYAMRAMLRLPGWNTLARRRMSRQTVDNLFEPAARIIEAERPRVILATSPPVESLLAAEALARAYRLPYVCDLRDPWTHFPWTKYRHWIDFVFERRKEREVLNQSAKVVANTPTARQILVERVRIQPSRVVVIPNGYDEAEFSDVATAVIYPGRFIVAYTGLLSTPDGNERGPKLWMKKALGLDYRPLNVDFAARSPRYVLAAAERLLDERSDLRRALLLLFVGNFAESDRREFDRFRYRECLEVKQPVSSKEALRICCSAQMLLLVQVGIRFRGNDLCPCVPGKLYNYLRTGTPILAALECKDVIDLIQAFDAGTVVGPQDVTGIATAMGAAIDRWRQGGTSLHRIPPPGLEEYSRRHLARHLAEVLWEVSRTKRWPAGLDELNVAKVSTTADRHSRETASAPQ